MAENYKHLYEQMKKMVAMYQDEIVPGMRVQLENRVEVVRCKDCKHWKDGHRDCTDYAKICDIGWYMVGENGYCVYGERREGE